MRSDDNFRNTLLFFLIMSTMVGIQPVFAEGHWILDQVYRDSGGRDDVSTNWIDGSDTSLSGETSWKWDTMDCSQKISSTFSWTPPPLVVQPESSFNMSFTLDQNSCSDCMAVDSTLGAQANTPTSMGYGNLGMTGRGMDAAQLTVGCISGAKDKKTHRFWTSTAPTEYVTGKDRDFAINIVCTMYQEWYFIQYYYIWSDTANPAQDSELFKPLSEWSVQEYGPMGNYDGIWKVSADGKTIEASWSDGRITDIIEIQSVMDNYVQLFRKGNNGYYTGTLSSDGIIQGTASWYSEGQIWTATNLKKD